MGNSFGTYSYPLWNQGGASLPSWQPYMGWSTTSTSSGSSSKKEETFEEYQKRLAKERAEYIKKQEENKVKIKEYQEKIKAAEEQLKVFEHGISDEQGNIDETTSRENVEKSLKRLENGKKLNDGKTAVYEEDLKDLSTWSKIKRGFMNGLSGIGNCCKSIVGFDKNGKWNPVKATINGVILVGAAALCLSGVGAPLGAALASVLGTSAATVAAAASGAMSALCWAGVGVGAFQVTKGIVNTAKAKTMEEFDNATQEIGEGTFTGVTSFMGVKAEGAAAGLKGLSKFNPLKVGRAHVETAYRAMAQETQNAQSLGNEINYFVRLKHNLNGRTFYNKIKVPESRLGEFNNGEKITMALEKNRFKLNWKTFKAGRSASRRLGADTAKRNFESVLSKTKSDLTSQINDVNVQIARATDNKVKTLLRMKLDNLKTNMQQIESTSDYTAWKNLPKITRENLTKYNQYLDKLNTDGNVRISGTTFNNTSRAELETTINEISKIQKEISKSLKTLRELRLTSMKKMAKHEFYSNEVTNFGYRNASGFKIKARTINSWKTFTGKCDSKKSFTFSLAGKGVSWGFLAIDPAWAAMEATGGLKPIMTSATCLTTPKEINADTIYTPKELDEIKNRLLAMQQNYTNVANETKSQIEQMEREIRTLECNG